MRRRSYTTPLPGARDTHTWDNERLNRSRNGGVGLCNTGSGKRLICALGGIGCDVDHITVARINLGSATGPQR